MPYFELKKGELNFPPAHFADLDGLLAVGGDMTAERLLHAYQSGLYYWHHPMKHIKWWSPDPRIVLETDIAEADSLLLTESTTTVNNDLEGLLRLCQNQYNQQEAMTPAWLSERMFRIFMELDEKGLVHSQEVWKDGELVGGFFGVCLGRICFGEYAVESIPGAATLAIVRAAGELQKKGVILMDMHKETACHDQLEYQEISRVAYIDLCRVAASEYRTASKTNMS
ncbi:MAG: GNAT family N-acetyltransferase [Robiginitalea sp.]